MCDFKVMRKSGLFSNTACFSRPPPQQPLFTFSFLCRVGPFPPLTWQSAYFPFKTKNLTFSHFPGENEFLSPQSLFCTCPVSFFISQCHTVFIFMSLLLGCEYREGKLHVALFLIISRIDSNIMKAFSC